MRAAVIGEWQLHHVLEIFGQHRLTPAMRQAVGVQGYEYAAADGEQPEGGPGREQRYQVLEGEGGTRLLCAGERIDDASEQNRLCELCGCERYVGEGQEPAQPGFRTEQGEHAAVEMDQLHFAGRSLSEFVMELCGRHPAP